MTNSIDDAYSEGNYAARTAIANGCPRWAIGPNASRGLENGAIDTGTGLPIFSFNCPPELVEQLAAQIRGHNDEILRALAAGEISVDFRPLLMTREQIVEDSANNQIGILSLDNPKIVGPDGRFALYIKIPKPRKNRKSEPLNWIVFEPANGEVNEEFSLYSEPESLAMGRGGRVLIIKSSLFYLSYDVETAQSLNRYMHHWPNGTPFVTTP